MLSTAAAAAAAAAVLLAAGPAGAADLQLLPHPMRAGYGSGGAPGLYAQYQWPAPDAAKNQTQLPPSKDMETDLTWITIPKSSNADGNGVFASSQYWYEAYDQPCPNSSDHGTSCNSAGYMGTQVMRGAKGQPEQVVFIFSCWDADSAHKVGWTTPSTCRRFGGEGTGSHCLLHLPVQEGVQHNFRVAYAGQNASGAFWTGTVQNKVTREKTRVGTLFYPHLPNRTGFGDLKVQSDDFLEYFVGGDCDGAVTTSVGIEGPYFHSRKLTALQAMPAYSTNPGDCNRSDVAGCIPGHGCGKPRVLLQGGAGVVRKHANGEHLWANSSK